MPTSSSRDAELDPGFAGHLVGYLLALAQVNTRRAFQRRVGEPFGLRPVEFTLLALLQANGAVSAKQIGSALRLPAPHVTTLVDRLAERGLVERGRDPDDGRAVRIGLTTAGRALAERLRPVALTMEDDLLAALEPAEQTALRCLLLKLARAD
ncbi:MAG: MarR family transcriptional regulator [Rubrivivax sp.]